MNIHWMDLISSSAARISDGLNQIYFIFASCSAKDVLEQNSRIYPEARSLINTIYETGNRLLYRWAGPGIVNRMILGCIRVPVFGYLKDFVLLHETTHEDICLWSQALELIDRQKVSGKTESRPPLDGFCCKTRRWVRVSHGRGIWV
jgi:hypothetical protein